MRSASAAATVGLTGGTLRLTATHLRTAWPRLLAWWLVCTVVPVAVVRGVVGLYPTETARSSYAATVGASPSVAAFNGRGYDLDTLGGIGAYEVGFMGQLLLPVAASLLVVGLTRAQEDAGRTELLTAYRLGRVAPLLAGALVTALVLLAAGTAQAVGFTAVGLPLAGSVRYAASLTAMTFFFAGVGLLAAELAQHARTATMLALAVLAATFLARVVVDALELDLVWLSPLGWLAEVRPFGSAVRWWPFAAYLLVSALLVGVAVLVSARRDLGSGVVAPRRGPGHGRLATATPVGWAWRLTRVTWIGWVVGTVLWGASIGLLAQEMTGMFIENPLLLQAMGVERATDLVSSLAGLVVVVLACATGVAGTLRLREEETAGRLGLVLAGRPSRVGVWAAWLGVVALQALGTLGTGLLCYGLGSWIASGDRHDLGSAAQMAGAYALPILLVVGVAGALAALLPRLAPLAWLPVGWVALVGMLADTLGLPEWARQLSPLDAVGMVPVETPSTTALMVLAGLTTALVVAAIAGGHRRDLRAG